MDERGPVPVQEAHAEANDHGRHAGELDKVAHGGVAANEETVRALREQQTAAVALVLSGVAVAHVQREVPVAEHHGRADEADGPRAGGQQVESGQAVLGARLGRSSRVHGCSFYTDSLSGDKIRIIIR